MRPLRKAPKKSVYSAAAEHKLQASLENTCQRLSREEPHPPSCGFIATVTPETSQRVFRTFCEVGFGKRPFHAQWFRCNLVN